MNISFYFFRIDTQELGLLAPMVFDFVRSYQTVSSV